jgi:hypothetical protein
MILTQEREPGTGCPFSVMGQFESTEGLSQFPKYIVFSRSGSREHLSEMAAIRQVAPYLKE